MPNSTPRSERVTRATVFAFATTAAMALVGYILMLPVLQIPSQGMATILLAIMAIGCIRAGQSSERPVRTSAIVGGLIALFTLLIIGSVFSDLEQGDETPSLAIMVAGWLVFGVVIGLVCGFLSRLLRSRFQPNALWTTRLALVTCLASLALLALGGVVTSAEAGLAVPDWPNTFGTNMFLYPLSKMTGGVFYEHAHRLFGALVGLMTLSLTIALFINRHSLPTRLLGILVSLWVIGQGILGGLRVDDNPLDTSLEGGSPIDALGIVHGVTGQMFVAMLSMLVAMTHTRWQMPPISVTKAATTRMVALVALITLLIQIALGALLRHSDLSSHAIFTHVGFSLVAAVTTILIALRFQDHARQGGGRLYKKLGMSTMHTLVLQMVLGGVALWAVMTSSEAVEATTRDLVFSTAHQTLGAILLVLVTQCWLWSRRLT
ncbi:MAG: heme A synthase [Phycisphaerales bacterium JB043]